MLLKSCFLQILVFLPEWKATHFFNSVVTPAEWDWKEERNLIFNSIMLEQRLPIRGLEGWQLLCWSIKISSWYILFLQLKNYRCPPKEEANQRFTVLETKSCRRIPPVLCGVLELSVSVLGSSGLLLKVESLFQGCKVPRKQAALTLSILFLMNFNPNFNIIYNKRVIW